MEKYERLHNFLREYYYGDIQKQLTEDMPALVIDFSLLDMFDPVLADELLENPDSILREFSEALKLFDSSIQKMNVRVKNLPEKKYIRLRNLRAEHIGKLLCTDVIVKSATEIKPQIYEIIYSCPECSLKTPIPQEDNTFIQKPAVCQCGFRGEFGVVDRKMYDFRWLRGVEPFEITTGEQPTEIMILVKEDLTTPKMQKKTDPGARLRLTGILKEVPRRIKGKVTTILNTHLEVNYIETSGKELDEIEITPEDEAKLLEMARDPNIFDRLRNSIAPGIYGFGEIKESLVLQLFGGQKHILPDGSRVRGNIHLLLTGDPGVGKSITGDSKILYRSKSRYGYCSIGKIVSMAKSSNTISTSIDSDRHLQLIQVGDDVFGGVSNKDTKILENDKNIEVPTINKDNHKIEWRSITAFIKHKSPEKLVEIKTSSGRSIVGTKDHTFLVLDKNCDISDFRGDLLNKTMYLPIPLDTHSEIIKKIDIGKYIKNNTNSIELNNIIKLNKGFGFFIGIFLAEGCILKSANGQRVSISTNSIASQSILSSYLRSLGLNASIKKTINGESVEIHSRNMVRFLEDVCYSGEKDSLGKGSGAIRKKIPEFAFFAPREFISGLLSGLFSGDGYIIKHKLSGNRTKDSIAIGLSTVSKELAYNTIEILSSIGMFSSIKKKYYSYKNQKKLSYNVYISGNYAEKFLRNSILLDRKIENNRFSEKDSLDCVPCGDLLYEIVKDLGYLKKSHKDSHERRSFASMMRTVKKRNRIGRRRLEKIFIKLMTEAIEKKNSNVMIKLQKISRILEGNIIWDKIEEINEVDGEDFVYDLFIENNNNFSANNIFVHNSMLLKLASSIVPRGRYVSGSGVSGVGLTASVRKDEVLGSWVLEAGALILCNKGLIAIDEFDKMSKDDQIAMHEATSIETVSIAKASIIATLPAETAVIAGANPRHGRFEAYKSILEQVDIPETLLSRFDLKFALKDIPDKIHDERMADHILSSRISPDTIIPEIGVDILRKYIAYAKRIENIMLTREAADMLKNFYVEMRNAYPDGGVVSITLRQYEALIRLAEASAKVRLDTKVTVDDARRSIRLVKFSLMQLGYDSETGRIDIDKIESGITSSTRSKLRIIQDIISDLQKETGKEVALSDVEAQAEEQGIEGARVRDVIERLKREGLIFEPKPGYIKKT